MPDRLDFQKLSFGVRRMGWTRFWIQVVLGIVVVGVLLFNNIGRRLARNYDIAVMSIIHNLRCRLMHRCRSPW